MRMRGSVPKWCNIGPNRRQRFIYGKKSSSEPNILHLVENRCSHPISRFTFATAEGRGCRGKITAGNPKAKQRTNFETATLSELRASRLCCRVGFYV